MISNLKSESENKSKDKGGEIEMGMERNATMKENFEFICNFKP